jgi:hypothetical protein
VPLIGFAPWLLYDMIIRDAPLNITNTVSGLVCLLTVVALVRYRCAQPRTYQTVR